METGRKNLDTILCEAIEIAAAAEREAYLDRACGDDAALRSAAERLIADHFEAGQFLERPAVVPDATIDQPITERPGTQIGPYKLLQEIGQGGMGVVYMAQQTDPVRRAVALKIIKPGMDTLQVIARFEAERQALSLMDHPNIAKVLDAGTTSGGRPYFVMELVKGQPITQYCNEKRLTTRQRLELLVPVCQAIQHAHQKGIIHRDIKPSNVLVAEYDQQVVPKVIDFGVAKAIAAPLTERTVFTGFGQLVGTIEYMSPEQAKLNQLDVDTRSDVYSLGVLMYELLTGSTPFDRQRLRSAAWDEMLRIIREEEPPKPSTRLSHSQDSLPSISAARQTEPARLTKLVRGELDWIVMKALEKDRNRRYESANGLALDVQRYLADEPVQACPPSAGYRLRKFIRKYRGSVAAAAVIFLSVVVGAAGAVYGVVESGKQRAAALQRQLENEQQDAAAAADRAARRSRTAASVATALEDGRARTREAWALALEPYKMRTATDLALTAIRRAEGFADAGEAPEETLAELAAVRSAAADLDRHTRLFVAADEALQAQDPMTGRELIAEKLGTAFREFGWDPLQAPDDVIAAEIAASRVRDKILGFLCDWENALPSNNPPHERIQTVIRAARQRSGGHLADWQQMKDAKDQIGLAQFAAKSETLTLGPELLCALSRDLTYHGVNWDAALSLLRRAADRYPAHGWVRDALTTAYLNASPPRRLEALREASAAAALQPDNELFQIRVGQVYANLGETKLAAAQYRKVIALSPKHGLADRNLAELLTQTGDPNGAAAVWREYIVRSSDASGYYNLGKALLTANDPAGAADAFREAIRHRPNTAASHDGLGMALRALGDVDGAIAAHKAALGIVQRERGPVVHIQNARENLWAALVQKYARRGMASDASLAAFAEMTRFDPNDPWPHVKLGTLLWDKGDTKGAVARYRDAVRIGPQKENRIPRIYDDYLTALESLASALLAEGDHAGAVAAYRERIRFYSNYAYHSHLGDVLAQAGDMAGAVAEYNEAIRIKAWDAESQAKLAKMLAAGTDDVRDGQQAIEHAIRACELSYWQEPRYIGILAAAYAEAGDFGKAVEHQNKALTFPEFEKQHGDTMRQRLNLYAHQQPYRETDWRLRIVAPPGAKVWKYWQAVNREPRNAQVRYNFGNALRAAGQLDQAEAAYREAVRLDGDHRGVAIDTLADLLLSRGNVKEAIATLQKIVTLDPEDAAARYRLGNALKSAGNPDEVTTAYRAAAALHEKKNPADGPGCYNAACYRAQIAAALAQSKAPDAANLAKEEADQAMTWLTKALAAGFDDFVLLEEDADLAALRGREDFRKTLADIPPTAKAHGFVLRSLWDKAAAEYAKADLFARPLNDDACGYACLLLIRGNREGYNRFCLDAVERAGKTEDPFEAFVLARTCAIVPKCPVDPTQAVQWAQQAVAGDQRPWYFHALGLAQYRAGQCDDALQSFTRANVEAWAFRDLNWLGLALVHHRLGHPDEARQCLDKGIQWLQRYGSPGPGRPANIHPVDWLEAQVLRREAEELIDLKPRNTQEKK